MEASGSTDAPPTTTPAYEPRGAAQAMICSKALEVLIEGPAGTGKTRAVLTKGHLCAFKYPGARILIVRQTRASLTESVLVTYEQKVCKPNSPWLRGVTRKGRESYIYPNGSVIVLGGMEGSGGTDNRNRIMSTEWDMVLGFEWTEVSENDHETLLTRLRNGKMPYQQMIVDCNPTFPEHWLNKRFPETHDVETGRRIRLLSRHADNPSVTPTYLDNLAALTGPRRARLFEGKWASAEGLVYDSFDRTIHVVARFDIPKEWRRIRVIDFGYTNPFVCQWWAIDGDGRMYLYREVYMSNRLVSDHAETIKHHSQGEAYEATIADHEDREGRETLHATGIFTIPAIKGVKSGIQSVQQRLQVAGDGRPRLFLLVDSTVERDQRMADGGRPTSTVGEFDSYVWQPAKDGKAAKEEPMKVNDHGMDAMRYGVAYVDRGLPAAAWARPGGTERHGEVAAVGKPGGRMGVAEMIENEAMWEDV